MGKYNLKKLSHIKNSPKNSTNVYIGNQIRMISSLKVDSLLLNSKVTRFINHHLIRKK